MKWLVYLLLLANVGLLALELRRLEPDLEEIPQAAASDGVKRLLLLREVDPARLESADKPASQSAVERVPRAESAEVGPQVAEEEVEPQTPPEVDDSQPAEPREADEDEAVADVPESVEHPSAATEGTVPTVVAEDMTQDQPDLASTTPEETANSEPPPTFSDSSDPLTFKPLGGEEQPLTSLALWDEALVKAIAEADSKRESEAEVALDADAEATTEYEFEAATESAQALESAVAHDEEDSQEELQVASADMVPQSLPSEHELDDAAGAGAPQDVGETVVEASASESSKDVPRDTARAPVPDTRTESEISPAMGDEGSTPTSTRLALSAASGPPQEPVDALAAKKSQPVCYRVGPFGVAGSAEAGARWVFARASASLGADTVSAAANPEEVRERTAVWIYLPPFDSREDANTKMREMRGNGVKDMYVVNEGDNKNAVSLGVYGHIPSLERRVADLRELGYEPQTIARYRTTTVHWLNIRLARPSLLSADDLVARFPDVTTESRACDGAF